MSNFGRFGIILCLLFATQLWASIGKVSLLKGEASATRDHQMIALATGALLEENDLIKTGENSQIQLVFDDKTVITLGSKSDLDIKEYINDAQNPRAKFKFTQGTFKSITGKIGKTAPENFKIETKTATIGIRGTTLAGQMGDQPGTPSLFACLSGAIDVTTQGGSVLVNAGFATTILSASQPPSPPVHVTPSFIQQLAGGGTSPQPQSPTPASPPQPLNAPSLATQAVQTSQQSTTYTNVIGQVTHYSDDFYPIFNPPLLSSSTHSGTISLSGLSTSRYVMDETEILSTIDTFNLTINSTNDSLRNNGETTFSSIVLDRDTDAITSLDLKKSSSSLTMTYNDLNSFSIKDFDNYKGWIQTENSYPNDYVSWGYWAVKAHDDSMLLPTTNYWVAGVDTDAAAATIASLIAGEAVTSYTYNGHVLGSVSDGSHTYAIDATNNNEVVFNFDFGGGAGSLRDSSYIKFQTEQTTPQSWNIGVSATIPSDGTTFSATNSDTVKINNALQAGSSSTVTGQFYGTSAEAVGGTFKATAGTSTASGVFKAVK